MPKIESSQTGLFLSPEVSLGVLPAAPVFIQQEPNGYSDFGSSISTMAREPITSSRQRKRATVNDLEATAGFSADFLQRQSQHHIAAALFNLPYAKFTTAPLFGAVTGDPTIAVTVTAADEVAVPTVGAVGAPLVVGSIVALRGSRYTTNNTALVVTAKNVDLLTFQRAYGTGNLAVDTTDEDIVMTAVGHRFDFGAVTFDVSGDEFVQMQFAVNATHTSVVDQLHVGEWLFIGGDAANSRIAEAPPFYARIAAIGNDGTTYTLSLDTTTSALVAAGGTIGTVGIKLDVYFGTFIRNPKDGEQQHRLSFTFDRTFDSTLSRAERVRGAVANELSLALASKEKATIDVGYMALNSCVRSAVTNEVFKPVTGETSYNLSVDTFRQRLAIRTGELNPAALFAFVQSMEFTIANNITADDAIGVLGAFDMTAGQFNVDLSVTAYLMDLEAVCAVRNNEVLGADIILAKQNQGVVVDVPEFTASNGRINVEKDTSVKIPVEGLAWANRFGYTVGFTFFDWLPDVAMPATANCDC